MAVTKPEKRVCRSEQRLKRVSAGRCPHCRLLFSNPVTLSCGHSLCALCCQELLERRQNLETTINCDLTLTPKAHQPGTPMRTPMMGIRIFSEFNDFNETPTKVNPDIRTPARPPKRFSLVIRAPDCPVCGQAASTNAPIKNHALAQVIRQMYRRKRDLNLATYKNPLYSVSEQRETLSPRPSSSSSGFESEPNIENVCIQRCNISILGWKNVGKTQLTRTQYLNNLFFGQIDTEKTEKTGIDEPELFAKYLIHIIDQPDFTKSLIDAHGFVLLYSITDRDSFEQLSKIIHEVQLTRKDEPAMIVCGTKSDLGKENMRKVSAYEGQQLARSLNCPFFEVSAKENDCVNELFAQLVQIIDNKNGL